MGLFERIAHASCESTVGTASQSGRKLTTMPLESTIAAACPQARSRMSWAGTCAATSARRSSSTQRVSAASSAGLQ